MPGDFTLPPPPRKTWRYRSLSDDYAELLHRELGVSRLVARLIAARELKNLEDVSAFLDPRLASLHDPLKMRDMDKAVERIAHALSERERIAIYGDYDVDGLTSTSLLWRFFRWVGCEVLTYIPNRLTEGYGMTRRGVDLLHSRGAQLIVTVDNGVNCIDEVAYAGDLGIDVVVTDHHQPGDRLPQAVAVVDPVRSDCDYPFKELSGVGVAFKLAHALARHLGKTPKEARKFLKSLFDLVALGTIADVVPLLGENRVLALHGLQALRRTDKRGLQAMMQMLGIENKPLTSETVAFLFGPRLNAAGRTGAADHGLELLLTEDEARSWNLSKFLDQLNQDRRSIESEVLEEVFEMLGERPELADDPVLIAAGPGWHQGIVGIVASRLVERFGRPALVLGIDDGVAKGSARSVPDFDLHRALGECHDLLTAYGGHRMAAGLSLPERNLDKLREALNRIAVDKLGGREARPILEVDTWANIDELTEATLNEIGQLRPFGHSNPAPVIALRGCRLVTEPCEVGKRHLKMRIGMNGGRNGDALTAIWFRYPAYAREVLAESSAIDVAGEPRFNHWNGRTTIELTIKDIRPSEE